MHPINTIRQPKLHSPPIGSWKAQLKSPSSTYICSNTLQYFSTTSNTMYVKFYLVKTSKHKILVEGISSYSSIALNLLSICEKTFTYITRFQTFKIDPSTSFNPLATIRLNIWVTHRTWLNSLPLTISLVIEVFQFNHSIAMSLVLALSTAI